MATNHTANYELSQWVAGDLILREDFNSDNAKIAAALHGMAVDLLGLHQWLNSPGEILRIASGSYVGNGKGGTTYAPNSLTFDFRPMVVFVFDPAQTDAVVFPAVGCMYRGLGKMQDAIGDNGMLNVTWENNGVSWIYPGVFASGAAKAEDRQYNTSGKTYQWIAIGYVTTDA